MQVPGTTVERDVTIGDFFGALTGDPRKLAQISETGSDLQTPWCQCAVPRENGMFGKVANRTGPQKSVPTPHGPALGPQALMARCTRRVRAAGAVPRRPGAVQHAPG